MPKSFVATILTSTLFLSATLASPTPAHAASLTDSQIQAIVSLLSSFGADAGVIANVNATLHGQATGSSAGINNSTTATNTTSSACLTLTHNLQRGISDAATNGEVSKLQQFLGVTPNGYFGPATQAAVQTWQSSHTITSSGFVGPSTRAAIGCSVSTTENTVQTATNNVTHTIQIPAAVVTSVPAMNATPAANTTITNNAATSASAVKNSSTVNAQDPTLSIIAPQSGATYKLGDTIPISWNWTNAPANTQEEITLALLQPSSNAGGVGGGSWQ